MLELIVLWMQLVLEPAPAPLMCPYGWHLDGVMSMCIRGLHDPAPRPLLSCRNDGDCDPSADCIAGKCKERRRK